MQEQPLIRVVFNHEGLKAGRQAIRFCGRDFLSDLFDVSNTEQFNFERGQNHPLAGPAGLCVGDSGHVHVVCRQLSIADSGAANLR